MAWYIDRDYDDEPDKSRVGTRSVIEPTGDRRIRFRIRDDDGEVYYGGWWDGSDIDSGPGSLYEALSWAVWDAGAVDLQLHANDAAEHGLYTGPADPQTWISVFG